jgi:hypothetical protein
LRVRAIGWLAVVAGIANHRRWVVREHARHRRQIADVVVYHAEERDDRGLVGGDAVEVALGFSSFAGLRLFGENGLALFLAAFLFV